MDAWTWRDNVRDALCHQRCHCGALGPWLIPSCCLAVKELFHKAFHPLKAVAPVACGEWSWHEMENGPGMSCGRGCLAVLNKILAPFSWSCMWEHSLKVLHGILPAGILVRGGEGELVLGHSQESQCCPTDKAAAGPAGVLGTDAILALWHH